MTKWKVSKFSLHYSCKSTISLNLFKIKKFIKKNIQQRDIKELNSPYSLNINLGQTKNKKTYMHISLSLSLSLSPESTWNALYKHNNGYINTFKDHMYIG